MGDFIEEQDENYNTILFTGKFGTYTLSERYCAITYFTLKDLKQAGQHYILINSFESKNAITTGKNISTNGHRFS